MEFNTSMSTWVASAVVNIVVTVLSIESSLTDTLISSSVIITSSIRMTGFYGFTFINVVITGWSSVARSSTVTSKVVDSINAGAMFTRKCCTIIYIFVTSLSLKTCLREEENHPLK